MDYREKAKDFLYYMKKLNQMPMIRNLSCMSFGEQAVLHYLSLQNDSVSAGELTSAFGIRSSRTAAILNALEKKGYALRSADHSDRRRVLVSITEEGRTVVDEKSSEGIEHTAAFLEMLGPEDAEEFIRIIRDAVTRNQKKESEYHDKIIGN